eukprot:Skav228745  [mRNA]  locus=scaffold4149:25590:30465:- [translate_table: standard]
MIPPARFGHTATQLPSGSNELLIVGGRDQMNSCRDLVRNVAHGGFGDHSGLHILDVAGQAWSERTFSGTPPEKAGMAVITSLAPFPREANDKHHNPGVELFLLDLEKWLWSQPAVQGAPAARLGMAAARSGTSERRVYLFGGVVLRGDQVMVDKTVYMLETVEAKDAKAALAAAAAKELDDVPTPVELDNEVEQQENFRSTGICTEEKAFFKLQSKKTSFPRSQVAEVRRKDNRHSKKSGQKPG